MVVFSYKIDRLPRPMRFSAELVQLFFKAQTTRSAAQMSYYLLFSMFPLLMIFVSGLGFFHLNVDWVLSIIHRLLPQVSSVVESYVTYILSVESPGRVVIGALMAITASSAAFRGLVLYMGGVTGKATFRGPKLVLVSILMSLVLLGTIFAFLLSAVTGRWFLTLLVEKFHIDVVALAWDWMRYLLALAVGILAISMLYRVSMTRRAMPGSKVWPGAVLASIGMVFGTALFSLFLNSGHKYSLIYGSLAGLILLLLWFFVCSNILLAGNLFNYLLAKRRQEKQEATKEERA